MVVLAILGLILFAAVPASVRMYESIQYRQSVRDIVVTLASARYRAINEGQQQDVVFHPLKRSMRYAKSVMQFPAEVKMLVRSARELNRAEEAVIRFYPDGGSSGGEVDIARQDGSGVRITIDWLVGRVTQEKYVFD